MTSHVTRTCQHEAQPTNTARTRPRSGPVAGRQLENGPRFAANLRIDRIGAKLVRHRPGRTQCGANFRSRAIHRICPDDARKPGPLRANPSRYLLSRVGISLRARIGRPEVSLSKLPATGALARFFRPSYVVGGCIVSMAAQFQQRPDLPCRGQPWVLSPASGMRLKSLEPIETKLYGRGHISRSAWSRVGCRVRN